MAEIERRKEFLTTLLNVGKGMIMVIKPNGLDKVRAFAIDIDPKDEAPYVEFGLNEEDKPAEAWACYVFGVCREMQKRGVPVKGFAFMYLVICFWTFESSSSMFLMFVLTSSISTRASSSKVST